MEIVLLILLKGLIAGTLVVVFALISAAVGPKSFAGIFGAAPSIALASLTITVLHSGVAAGRMQSYSMIFAAFAMVAYCVTAVITVDRYGALRGSVLAYGSWVAVAALAFGIVALVH
jgi:hypothetical protein